VPTPHTPPTAVATATFAAPVTPREVWLYRLDFANLPEYNPDVSGVARVGDGAADGVGGILGPGARYTFRLADAWQEGIRHPVELWLVDVVEPSLVAAGMAGGSEAYEEFVVHALDAGGCEVTLTLWVTLPEGLPDDVVAAAAAGSLEQISKEVRLMKEVLEARAGVASGG
jgi:Polyketide cyclase / dehydrase and lipid transport